VYLEIYIYILYAGNSLEWAGGMKRKQQALRYQGCMSKKGGRGHIPPACICTYVFSYIYNRYTYAYSIIGGVKTHVHIIAKRAKSKPSFKHTNTHT